MNSSPNAVLILCNLPDPDSPWQQSDGGVLSQAKAVSDAIGLLGRSVRLECVSTLDEVRKVLSRARETIVFNLVESLLPHPSDANEVAAICLQMGKTATGCEMILLDKWQTKAAFDEHGIATPRAVKIETWQVPDSSLCPPGRRIVKPVESDASEGIWDTSVVGEDHEALAAAVKRVHDQLGQAAIVEQYIDGQELNVSLLQTGDDIQVLPLAEIDFSAFAPGQPRILDYAAKWHEESFAYNNTPRKIPAEVSQQTAELVRTAARNAWYATNCRDYARVDFRVDKTGKPWVLEVNPNPDISPDAGFQAALSAGGIEFCEFVNTILSNAQRRMRN